MKNLNIIVLISICLLSCNNETAQNKIRFLTAEVPVEIPIPFKENLTPKNKLIHKGIFSPDFEEYYYTLSDTNYEQFDVYVMKKKNGVWSEPEKAFFNSDYDEHGMCFSPDGNSVYFSSTRPTNIEGISTTWHIWHSEKVDEKWNKPKFVDIPNLRNKLVSHPTISNTGTMYFHTSNLDYSNMDIYYSKKVNYQYEEAKKASIAVGSTNGKCTPYISPKENYLIFASIGEQLELMISYNDGEGNWTKTKKLNKKINENGQGNPYVTPDNQFLFFTTGRHLEKDWKVKWVNIKSVLTNN